MAYNNNKDDYKVDNIVIELDTDEDTEEAEDINADDVPLFKQRDRH